MRMGRFCRLTLAAGKGACCPSEFFYCALARGAASSSSAAAKIGRNENS